jgi:hypothetical protein
MLTARLWMAADQCLQQWLVIGRVAGASRDHGGIDRMDACRFMSVMGDEGAGFEGEDEAFSAPIDSGGRGCHRLGGQHLDG